MAAAVITVAQLAQGIAARTLLGKGVAHIKPRTHHKMTGTQIQCSASLVGLWWLSPYSLSHWFAVRMPQTVPHGGPHFNAESDQRPIVTLVAGRPDLKREQRSLRRRASL